MADDRIITALDVHSLDDMKKLVKTDAGKIRDIFRVSA